MIITFFGLLRTNFGIKNLLDRFEKKDQTSKMNLKSSKTVITLYFIDSIETLESWEGELGAELGKCTEGTSLP